MDGEELLNLFYHGSVIRRVGDAKEQLCHAMWTSLSTYSIPEEEQPCLVLLSNQATYFLTANLDHTSYGVDNVKHEDLQEVLVGAYHQFVRLGGKTEADYYCCISRDPSLVHVFITRLSFIVDTDFVKAASPEGVSSAESDSDEEVSIYDTHASKGADDSEHPSGVRFIYGEEQCLKDVGDYLVTNCDVVESELQIISVDYIHVSASEQLQPLTLVLTKTAIYLIRELYVNHIVSTQPNHNSSLSQPYFIHVERTIELSEIGQVSLDEASLAINLLIGEDEQFVVHYSSATLAQSFLTNCSLLAAS